MHNIYYATILDVIIQCELGREPGGQTSLPDNNLNAYKVFETLNARGVQLSTPDLLKNYLFSISVVLLSVPIKSLLKPVSLISLFSLSVFSLISV
jgi:hypothetical protein